MMVAKARAAGDRLAEFSISLPSAQKTDTNHVATGNAREQSTGRTTTTREPFDATLEVREDVETGRFDRDATAYDHFDEQSLVDDQSFHSAHGTGTESGFACMKSSCMEQTNDKEATSREQQVGIDFFDLIESACCGELKGLKMKVDGECGKGKTFSELAVCKNFKFDERDEDEASDDYESTSSYSKPRPAVRGRNTGPKGGRRNLRRPYEDKPKERNRSTNPNTVSQDNLKFVAEIARKASDFISQNVKTEEDLDTSSFKESPIDKVPPIANPAPKTAAENSPAEKSAGEKSAFEKSAADAVTCATAESTAIASQVVPVAPVAPVVRPDHERMRELCVLSLVGSGSTVSSFDEDGGGHSWSLHTKKKRASSPSDLTALTTNRSQEVSIASCRRALESVVNFLDSLTRNIYGKGAAPVNKAVCFLCLSIIVVLWPAAQEGNRRKVEKVEIPRPHSPVSLLKAVLRGDTKEAPRAL